MAPGESLRDYQPFPSDDHLHLAAYAADAANAGLAALKAIIRGIPEGPAREAIELMMRKPDELAKLLESVAAIARNSDELAALTRHEDAIAVLLKGGPEVVELVAKHGDVGVRLVAEYGDEGLSTLRGLRGQGLGNVRSCSASRLRGYLRGDTHLLGGEAAARDLFEDYVGRSPIGRLTE